MTRNEVIEQAIIQCMKELYSYAVPYIKWEEFEKKNEVYSNKCKIWENFSNALHNKEKNPQLWVQYKANFPNWENKSMLECVGPKPFEFYYLPKEIIKDVFDSYVYAYRFDSQQELLSTILILKDYCRCPIVSKHFEKDGNNPGYRGYENPDNLEKVINKYLDLEFPLMDPERALDADDFDNKLEKASKELQDKFFEFLDMAGKFYNWNSELNTFSVNIYLGASPNSNKEAVIENWKKYRNQDIEIDEEQIKKEYYGEEDFYE